MPNKGQDAWKSGPLSQEESAFLERGGALVADISLGSDHYKLTKALVDEYENIVATALLPKEVFSEPFFS